MQTPMIGRVLRCDGHRRLSHVVGFGAGVAMALVVLVAGAAPASAHPLGNFSTNVYSGLRVQPRHVLVDYVVDLAELPTVQAKREVGRVGTHAWAAGECARLAAGVRVDVGGARSAVAVQSSAMAYADGAGGLPTLRLTCLLEAQRRAGSEPVAVRYEDMNFPGRVGWREITAIGDGTTVAGSDVPSVSVSHRLARYPTDLLSSPLHVTRADFHVTPGGPLAGPAVDSTVPGGARPLAGDQLTARFTALVGRQHVDAPFVLLALALATLLGAIHAFAPGHGKTVMAAYLVGQRGSLRQALLIGASVTLTHTFGVLVLGLILSASSILAPERLYPWLTVASGVLFASIGMRLLLAAVRQRRAVADRPAPADAHAHTEHAHAHAGDGHEHAHGGMVHSHVVAGAGGAQVGWRSLLVLGLAGGMVPTPSALIVLLGAIALGRVWLGVALVLAYGVGMAATLTGAGLLLLRARGLFERRSWRWRGNGAVAAAGRLVPLATAGLIVLAGTAVVARGVSGF